MSESDSDLPAAARVRMGRPGTAGAERDRFGLTGVSSPYDPRVVAIRADLADIAVAGVHFAPHYAAPMMRSCIAPRAAIHDGPDASSEQISELLHGEGFALLDLTAGWAWGYCLADHYVGYLDAAALGPPIAPTHRVRQPGAGVFADTAGDPVGQLPGGALVMGTDERAGWVQSSDGYLRDADLVAVDHRADDPVAVAESLIGTPYLWGGRSSQGVDCSGLVQLAWAACGVQLPRDSDLQLAALDQAVAPDALQRGDLVFFPGHVGMMVDATTLLHATRFTMTVRTEPLADVIARSQAKGHDPAVAGYRRVR